MAELTVRRLALALPVGSVLRALDHSTALPTATLVCLSGQWADGATVIGWNPVRVRAGDGPRVLADQPMVAGNGAAFGGGWIGWLEFAGGSWFGFFDTVLRADRAGAWWLESIGDHPGLDELADVIEALADSPAGELRIDAVTSTGREQHLAAVESAISAIRVGQLYQVNVCGRLTGQLAGSAIDLFVAGLSELAPAYAALVRTPDRTVVSLSPELFLDRRGNGSGTDLVRTAPIKGTRRRTVAGDRLDDPAAQQLLHSSKDRAENIMIVDLMRNDLSQVCRPGTVRPVELLAVRPAPGVWHLVSEVTGELVAGAGDPELLAAAFPPGSVTGAPKLPALDLIAELEATPRGLYTGAIGYSSSASNRSEFNVAIRTFEIAGRDFQLGVGGGITADSVPMAEWQECLIKAAPLLALGGHVQSDGSLGDRPLDYPDQVELAAGLYETMLSVGGRIVGLADHLTRLATSWLEVFGQELPADLSTRLVAAAAATGGRQRIRLTIRPDRSMPLIETAAIGPPASTVAVYRQAGRTGCWRHKWADRRWLAALERPDALPLFGSDRAGVAETSRGNVAVVSAPGVLRTPVLSDDILPGITRRRLLDAALDHGWRVELGRVGFDELEGARLVLGLSSINEVVGIERLDGRRLGLDVELLGQLRGWLSAGHG